MGLLRGAAALLLALVLLAVVCALVLRGGQGTHGGAEDAGDITRLVLSNYLKVAAEQGRIDLPADAIERWGESDPGLAHLYAAAVKVLRAGRPAAVAPPPVVNLPTGTLLYNIQPTDACELRAADWFVLDESDLPTIAEFVRATNPGATPRLCVYKTVRAIALAALNANYTYLDLERWIRSVDPGYEPSFNDLGSGDNGVAAAWLAAHGQAHKLQGWLERPGTLPVPLMMVEVMITHAARDLVLVRTKTLEP